MTDAEPLVSLGRMVRLTESVARSHGLDIQLATILKRVAAAPGVDTVRVFLTDPSEEHLIAQAELGFGDFVPLDEAHRIPLGTGFTGRVAATREPLVVDVGIDEAAFPVALRRAGIRSAVGVPLLAGRSLIGVMNVGSRQSGSFGPDAVAPLQDLAELVALAAAAILSEQALGGSERRFRAVFDDAPIGASITGLRNPETGRILLANSALARITGYTVDQLQGMHFRDLLPPTERVVAEGALGTLASSTAREYSAERRSIRADGDQIWVRTTTSAVSEDGEPAYAVSYIEDITERRAVEENLARRAMTDPLTGLANRHLVLDHLTLALRQQARSGGLVGVLYLDLDRFKLVNDVYGHEAGDRMLQEVARRLTSSVRDVDTAGRLGGDEFIVICPRLSGPDELELISRRITDALDYSIRLAGNVTLEVSASVGAALGDHNAGAEELVRRADVAMYEAKRLGRRRAQVFAGDLDQVMHERLATEQMLREALQHGWFCLHYQVQVELATKRVANAEALLRIQHPVRGLILPEDFLDILEDSDLAEPVETWVLGEACRQLARWSDHGPRQLGINISRRLAAGGRLAATVLAAVRTAGVDPSRLVVELTERALVQAGPAVLEDVASLSEHGVRIALDNFGTGYGSLACLNRFPVSSVKIDRSFVAGMVDNPADDAIVTAVVALGAALGLNVVAEGIEEDDQLDRLLDLGCLLGQGNRFGAPHPADRFWP